jgi:hypothetical protein
MSVSHHLGDIACGTVDELLTEARWQRSVIWGPIAFIVARKNVAAKAPRLSLLGPLSEEQAASPSALDRLLARVGAATDNLTFAEPELAACQIECLLAHRTLS